MRRSQMSRSSRSSFGAWVGAAACAAAVFCALTSPIAGQTPAPAAAPQAPAAAPAPPAAPPEPAPQPSGPTIAVPATPVVSTGTDGGRLSLIAGRSMVLNTEFDIRRFSFTNVVVADGTVVSPRELLID